MAVSKIYTLLHDRIVTVMQLKKIFADLIVMPTCRIIIMVFVLLRMKKLSLKSNNTTEVTARMSSIPDDSGYDVKPPPSGISYDEELLS